MGREKKSNVQTAKLINLTFLKQNNGLNFYKVVILVWERVRHGNMEELSLPEVQTAKLINLTFLKQNNGIIFVK